LLNCQNIKQIKSQCQSPIRTMLKILLFSTRFYNKTFLVISQYASPLPGYRGQVKADSHTIDRLSILGCGIVQGYPQLIKCSHSPQPTSVSPSSGLKDLQVVNSVHLLSSKIPKYIARQTCCQALSLARKPGLFTCYLAKAIVKGLWLNSAAVSCIEQSQSQISRNKNTHGEIVVGVCGLQIVVYCVPLGYF
jgi:hypothetical protein